MLGGWRLSLAPLPFPPSQFEQVQKLVAMRKAREGLQPLQEQWLLDDAPEGASQRGLVRTDDGRLQILVRTPLVPFADGASGCPSEIKGSEAKRLLETNRKCPCPRTSLSLSMAGRGKRSATDGGRAAEEGMDECLRALLSFLLLGAPPPSSWSLRAWRSLLEGAGTERRDSHLRSVVSEYKQAKTAMMEPLFTSSSNHGLSAGGL